MGRHDELFRALLHELLGMASLMLLFDLSDEIDLDTLQPMPADWISDELRATFGDSL